MTDYSHILLNKSPLQLRLLGARGGKAFGRNQRLRRAPLPTPPPATAALPALPRHTTAEAIAELDARSPWLRGAERRPGPGRRATPLCDLSKTSDRLSIRNVRYADLLIPFMTPLVPEQHVFFQ